MEAFHDLCQDCAVCHAHLDSLLNSKPSFVWLKPLRKWALPKDIQDNCSFCGFVAQLNHETHHGCDAVSHSGLTLWIQFLTTENFVRPPIKATYYLDFKLSCEASLWYFFEDGKERQKGAIGFAQQVNPKLDETDWHSIRQWVDGCLQRHQSNCICRDPFDVPGFEVIDCNTRELVPWDKKADFVALSYVWGQAQTQAVRSEDSSETQIDRTTLPNPFLERVIEDALICASKLDIRYLWVDRYCIDQEDTDNTKQRLIQSMDKIYSAAIVTIINVAGNDAFTGLPGVSKTLRISKSKITIGSHSVIPFTNPNHEITSSKWFTRGWTLQEGLLARRRLVFTNTKVYFQCTQSHCVEGLFGEFNPEKQGRGFGRYPDLASQAFPSSVIGSDSLSFGVAHVCNKFMRRNLETDEDALNACLGIFSRFWTSTKPEYQYRGLPFQAKSTAAFSSALLWTFNLEAGWDRHRPIHPALMPFRRAWGPSWSWLAWRGHMMTFSHSVLQRRQSRFKMLVDIKIPRRHEEQDVMSTISGYVDDIDSGGLFQHWLPYLRLSGWIATMRFEHSPYQYGGDDDNLTGFIRCRVAKGQEFIGIAYILPQMWAKVLIEDETFKSSRLLDVMFIADDGTDIHCLVIRRIGEETADTFERLGTCAISYDSPEIKQVQNIFYLTVRERNWRHGVSRNLECRFDTITLL